MGYGYEGRLHILNYAEFYKRVDKEVGTGGYSHDIDTIGAESPRLFSAKSFTGDEGTSGRPTRFYGGVSRTVEKESFAGSTGVGAPTTVKLWIFDVGGRF